MGEKYKVIAVIVISLFIIGFFLSIYVTKEEKMPGNAILVVTEEDKFYHSIHFDHICVRGKKANTKTLSEAVSEGYKPHAHDQDLNYFRGNRRFLFHDILSKLGVQVNSRWDKNGNWLW